MSILAEHAPVPPAAATPPWMLWTGRAISALPILMMGVGGVMMLINPAPMMEKMPVQGWPTHLARPLAIIEVACALLYALPQTAVVGAILMTGYLGGAVATHIRIGQTGMATPAVVCGVLVWLGLLLRDARVRTLLPLRRI